MENASLGIFDPSLGIFDPARRRRNPDFLGGFPPKPRSVLRNKQGISRLSRVSTRAREGKTHAEWPMRQIYTALGVQWPIRMSGVLRANSL